jgi:hypothetical protein
MSGQKLFNRKWAQIRPAMLSGALLVLLAVGADANDPRFDLRQRLDSIEVETQLRKRQGRPIGDLEAAADALRDSLIGLREYASVHELDQYPPSKNSFWAQLASKVPFMEGVLAYRPGSMLDWVMVGTGAVALFSLLLLAIGLFVGRKKRAGAKKDKKKERAVSRMNLAQTGSHPAVGSYAAAERQPGTGAAYGANGRMLKPAPDAQREQEQMASLQSLMEQLRKVAPPPEPPPVQPAPVPIYAPPPEQTYVPPFVSPPPAAPVAAAPLPPEPAAPPPLILNAPDNLPPPPLVSMGPGTGASSGPLHAAAINELVAAAAESGLNEQEISRRYQISVDQVRLILRMKQK